MGGNVWQMLVCQIQNKRKERERKGNIGSGWGRGYLVDRDGLLEPRVAFHFVQEPLVLLPTSNAITSASSTGTSQLSVSRSTCARESARVSGEGMDAWAKEHAMRRGRERERVARDLRRLLRFRGAGACLGHHHLSEPPPHAPLARAEQRRGIRGNIAKKGGRGTRDEVGSLIEVEIRNSGSRRQHDAKFGVLVRNSYRVRVLRVQSRREWRGRSTFLTTTTCTPHRIASHDGTSLSCDTKHLTSCQIRSEQNRSDQIRQIRSRRLISPRASQASSRATPWCTLPDSKQARSESGGNPTQPSSTHQIAFHSTTTTKKQTKQKRQERHLRCRRPTRGHKPGPCRQPRGFRRGA
eukprot:2461193-Rhodomonas_salina.3